MREKILIFVFLLTSIGVWAQTRDTIHVVKDTVYINKEVLFGEQKVIEFSAFGELQSGISKLSNVELSTNDRINFELGINTKLLVGLISNDKYGIKTGVGIGNVRMNINFHDTRTETYNEIITQYDTTGSFTVIRPEGIETVYLIDTITSFEEKEYIVDTSYYDKVKLQLYSIPLSISYKYSLKSFYILPEIGINYNLVRITENSDFQRKSYDFPSSFFEVGGSLAIEKKWNRSFSSGLGIRYSLGLGKKARTVYPSRSDFYFSMRYFF